MCLRSAAKLVNVGMSVECQKFSACIMVEISIHIPGKTSPIDMASRGVTSFPTGSTACCLVATGNAVAEASVSTRVADGAIFYFPSAVSSSSESTVYSKECLEPYSYEERELHVCLFVYLFVCLKPDQCGAISNREPSGPALIPSSGPVYGLPGPVVLCLHAATLFSASFSSEYAQEGLYLGRIILLEHATPSGQLSPRPQVPRPSQ